MALLTTNFAHTCMNGGIGGSLHLCARPLCVRGSTHRTPASQGADGATPAHLLSMNFLPFPPNSNHGYVCAVLHWVFKPGGGTENTLSTPNSLTVATGCHPTHPIQLSLLLDCGNCTGNLQQGHRKRDRQSSQGQRLGCLLLVDVMSTYGSQEAEKPCPVRKLT